MMSGTNTLRVMTDNKRGTVTELNKEESRKLRAIWDGTREKPSQAAFGEMFGIGSQAAVGHFLNGHAAISLKAARGFAEGLKCDISDFSPRLAEEAAKLGKAAGAMSDQIDMTALGRMELQLVMLFRGLSAEHKDELMQHANNLYITSHPAASPANPFSTAPHPPKAPAKPKRSVDAGH
jgi:hypothetical protein